MWLIDFGTQNYKIFFILSSRKRTLTECTLRITDCREYVTDREDIAINFAFRINSTTKQHGFLKFTSLYAQ